MKIAGIMKSSLIDYPGKASAVVFLGGCNFRCGYCHNPDIVLMEGGPEQIEEQELFAFLEKRKRFLDAVCITGGEPTLHSELYDFIVRIKDNGMAVKLDTNGTNPDLLERLLAESLVDFVAMDIKAPAAKYSAVVQTPVDEAAVFRSSSLLRHGNVPYEFRTTLCRELLTEEDIGIMLSEHPGWRQWYLQTYRDPGKILGGGENFSAYSPEEMKAFGRRFGVKVRT